MEVRSPIPRYPGIEAVRGVAAMLIVLCHTAAQLNRVTDDPAAYDVVMCATAAGVDLFFVISGFVIFHSFYDEKGAPRTTPQHFAARRAARIYPMYWLVIAAMIAAIVVGFFASISLTPRAVIAAITLFPTYDTLLPISWTLSLEIIFYLWFTLFAFSGRRGATLAGVASCVLGSMALSRFLPPSYLRDLLSSDIQLEFIGGMALGFVVSVTGRRVLAPWWLMIVGAAYLILSPWFVGHEAGLAPEHRGLLWGPAVMAIVAGATAIGKPLGWRRLFSLLGEASYSIYLTHVFVTGALHVLLARGLLPASPGLIAPFAVAAAVTGVAAHRWVERPLLARARQWADQVR